MPCMHVSASAEKIMDVYVFLSYYKLSLHNGIVLIDINKCIRMSFILARMDIYTWPNGMYIHWLLSYLTASGNVFSLAVLRQWKVFISTSP